MYIIKICLTILLDAKSGNQEVFIVTRERERERERYRETEREERRNR
jgi:hypothetical protein